MAEPYRGELLEFVCLQCRAPADPGHRFCGRCGTPLHQRCPVCRTLLAPGQVYCTSCGHAISQGGGPTPAREERRTISVLFVDMAGFTGIGERLDPEDLHQLQMAYFTTASEVIRRYGGVPEKYIGDAVMAVFGVPVQSEHDGYRAVRTGLELQRALDDQPLAGRYRMRLRVGVATGEALVDLNATHPSGEAMVSGEVVATAARLQQYAPDGGVLVSAATRRTTVGLIRYGDQPHTVSLAGKAQPVEVWLAQGLAGRAWAADDDSVPLVGRTHELDLITGALVRCVREREARLVSIVGVHGVGKSRLVRELTRRVADAPDVVVRWRVGRCLPYSESSPYSALADIIKAQADLQDTDDEATARGRVREALIDVVPESDVERLADLIGPLAGLAGRPVNAGEIEGAWRTVLIALASKLPTALVVEDLHFADPAMLRFLTSLVESVSDVPLFVLCTYRPELLEDHPAWAGGPPGTLSVSLGPLRGAARRALIVTLLRHHGLPETLTDRLAEITAGNPMYAVEYVRMLAERAAGGDLEPDAELAIPETVHGVVANRIDLLDGTERLVLHAAAVLGDSVWPGAVAAMASLPVDDVARALRRLTGRDMLVTGANSALANEAELTFRHQLLRDVAYRRLPRSSRAILHRRAAAWFDQLSVAGRHDLVAAVARHHAAALAIAENLGEDTRADAEAARRALLAASDAAFAVHAVEPALAHLQQALGLWAPDVEPAARLDAELRRWRVEFLADSDRFYREGGAKELLRIAERLQETGDLYAVARAHTLLGQAEYMRTEQDRAGEYLRRAVSLFQDLPDSAAKAEAHGELARLHLLQYRPEEALDAARQARELAERLRLSDAAAGALISESTARYLTADPSGLDGLSRAVEMCRAQRLPQLRRAAANLSTLLLEEGELRRGAELAAEANSAYGMRFSPVVTHSAEAEWAYFSGDWIMLLQAAEAFLDGPEAESTEWDLQLRARRAWIRLLCDEPAGNEVERCLTSARRSGFRRLRYNACAHGALYEALRGDEDAALALLAELAQVWREGPTTITLEWLSAVVHTAAVAPITGLVAAEIVGTVPRRTRWIEAADAMIAGSLAAARGECAVAAREWVTAAVRYDAIGGVSDAVLATTFAARAYRTAGDHASAASQASRVHAFARRNRAHRLAALVD